MKKPVWIIILILIFWASALRSQDKNALAKIKLSDSIFKIQKDSGIAILQTLIKKLRSPQNDYELAMAYKTLGCDYYYLARFPEALDYYQKCERITDKHDFYDIESSLKNLLGTFYKKQKIYIKAEEEFKKGYELAVNLRDTSNIAGFLGDLGLIFAEQNDYKTAKPYFEKSLALYLKIDNDVGASYAYDYLAEAYAVEGKFDEAILLMKKALVIRQNLNDEGLVAVNLNNIGEIYLQNKKFSEAITYLTQSVDISKKLRYVDLLQHTLGLLAECNKNIKNFEAAYHFNEQKNSLKDSIYNERNSQIIFESEAKYQSAKKQNQIDKLHAVNTINEVKVSKQKSVISFFIIILIVVAFALIIIIKYYRKVKKSHTIITAQQIKTELQKKIIEEKQHEILDSINYAQRIQKTILAQDSFLKQHLSNNYFVLFKPKDIVSGDFYWACAVNSTEHSVANAPASVADDQLFYLAVCDSTGHGVPGAFMSLLNIGYLSEAIKEKNIIETGAVLDYVRQRLITSVSRDGQRDGFDGILLRIENNIQGTKTITYSAAYNNPVLISNNLVVDLQADKMPVGIGERQSKFTTYTIQPKTGDVLYLFTDGYADQFGGSKGKKIKYKQLETLLLSNSHLPLPEQRDLLETAFENWRGNLEQIDDVLIMGIRF